MWLILNGKLNFSVDRLKFRIMVFDFAMQIFL